MDEHEARLPRMLEMIRESKEFLKTLDQEDEMKLQTEGLAHAAATAEEATHYLKHFDMRYVVFGSWIPGEPLLCSGPS